MRDADMLAAGGHDICEALPGGRHPSGPGDLRIPFAKPVGLVGGAGDTGRKARVSEIRSLSRRERMPAASEILYAERLLPAAIRQHRYLLPRILAFCVWYSASVIAPLSLACCKSIICCPTVGDWGLFVEPPPSWIAKHPVRSVIAERPINAGMNSFFIRFSFLLWF